MKHLKFSMAILCTALMLVPSVQAQQAPADQRNGSWLARNSFTGRFRYSEIEPINITNSPRLEQLVRAGRIYLSLQDAIALALENNLDIELQRYGARIAEADLLRAQAGGLLRGIPTSISTGPQSAASLQTGAGGGTGIGAVRDTGGGGAGSGTIITSTGTSIPNLDEQIFVGYTWGHRTLTQPNSFSTGIPSLVFNSSGWGAGIQKGFLTGTTVTFGVNTTSQSSNNLRAEINPFTNGNANIELRQRLLQGFGIAANSRFIRIAKNDIRISDLVFRQQVIQTVSAIVNLYADLVSFNEDVRVRRQALQLNEKLYSDNRKQVEIGTLAPIEIVRAEAEVARSQQELTASETQLLQQETIIKNALSRSGVNNPLLANARIVPTDPLQMPPATEQIRPVQDLVQVAIENRPEIRQTELNLENAKISLAGSKSQLLPSLDLVATAQNNGLAGQINTLPIPADMAAAGFVTRRANPVFVGGIGDVFSQIFSRNYPDYSIGFQLSVPIRNRAAQSDVVRDQLMLRQAEIRQRQQLNQVTVDVQNALIALQQARSRYQAAEKSRVLQEQTLDAEQKKYALGASTIFFVIQAQRDLAAAQAAEVSALSAYNRARVQMDLATGQTLANFDISIDEAVKGRVGRAPSALPALEPGQGRGNGLLPGANSTK
ncbi:MAG TPA: TolC family protein [Bryobacteraceae bacterium]|nr:TolC family protein [Bryobacteraceae bacterium]